MLKQYKSEFLEFLKEKGVGPDAEQAREAAQPAPEKEPAGAQPEEQDAKGEAGAEPLKAGAAEQEEAGKQEQPGEKEPATDEALAVRITAEAGFLPERLEDAVILVLAKVRAGKTPEEATMAVAEANPEWTKGELPKQGGNPAKKRAQKKEAPKLI